MRGIILSGSKNLFTVRPVEIAGRSDPIECRLKGKVLQGTEGDYNPLAPGDIVEFSLESALIESRSKRRCKFSRWNDRVKLSQTLAANLDLVLCVTTPDSPPFRPRFVDRVLLQAEAEGISAAIILNKCDIIPTDSEAALLLSRLADFEKQGYPVLRVSAKTGEGFEALSALLDGKLSLLTGQSGVGKSSILNRLFPNTNTRTGSLNPKWERGRHTTVTNELYESAAYSVIDSPGVRLFTPCGIEEPERFMRDIAPFAVKCVFGASCSHTHEEGCAVRAAVQAGAIHEDRYESFLRLGAGQ